MAEQTSTGYFQNVYKFNGKSQRSEDPDPSGQLDTETGLYYYGARYYDPRGSLWLSVDPMMEKYAGWSPYNYTVGNPVVFVDPDGMDIDPATAENVKHLVNKDSKQYNAAFAEQYKKLEEDHNAVYFFNPKNNRTTGNRTDLGNVEYMVTNENGQYNISINYSTKAGNTGFSNGSCLLEETFHAVQFSEGKFGFSTVDNSTIGFDIYDEAEAQVFAAQNTTDQKFNLENNLLKAYTNGGIDKAVEYLLGRPSLSNVYGQFPKYRVNVEEALKFPENDHLRPFFQPNGQSRIKSMIMQKPKN
ncbi:MAG: RHS repeat-associated core domain-containing protein [Bacteroidales bacterium]|nr:RHS repeat-associated core domain-containing protein [Bacteroidales bacterium]